MNTQLKQVDYSHFRQIISISAGQKIKNKGLKTYIYDHRNNMLALLTSASIDAFGKTRPTQYFVRSSV